MARFSPPTFAAGFKRQFLACLAAGLAAGLISFYINLPVRPLADRAVQAAARQGLGLTIDRPALVFPFGLKADRVEVKVPDLPRPPIPLSRVSITPAWTSLFGANPGADLEAVLMGGRVQAGIRRQGDLSLNLRGVQLSEDLGPGLPLQVAATVDAGSFNGRLPLAGRNVSELDLSLNNASLVGLQHLGAKKDRLSLGSIRLKARGRGAVFKLSELKSTGGDITVSGTGSLTVGRTPATSRLALTLQFKPAESLDPGLRDLLKLVGKTGKDGSQRLRLSGPLTAIQAR